MRCGLKHNGHRPVFSGRAHNACLTVKFLGNQIRCCSLCSIVELKCLVIHAAVVNNEFRQVNHHFLAFNTRKECHLTASCTLNAAILTAFVIELQRCLANGYCLRCRCHDDNGGILYCNWCAGGERSYAFGLSFGCNIRYVKLHFGSNLGRFEYVALYIEVVGSVAESLAKGELIAASLFSDSSVNGSVAIIEFQGCGFHHALVLCQVE